jgi:hypothetical protein
MYPEMRPYTPPMELVVPVMETQFVIRTARLILEDVARYVSRPSLRVEQADEDNSNMAGVETLPSKSNLIVSLQCS